MEQNKATNTRNKLPKANEMPSTMTSSLSVALVKIYSTAPCLSTRVN